MRWATVLRILLSIELTTDLISGVFTDSGASSGTRWMVPYSRNAEFTGRTRIIEEIEKQTERRIHNRISLYGLGGCGCV